MLKLYVYAGLAIAVLAGVWYVRHLQTSRDAYEARALSAEDSIVTLRTAYEHERKIAKEASDGYQADLARLNSERDNVPVVRLRKCPASMPASSSAAERPDAASPGHVSEAVEGDTGPDIGAEILEYGIACEANALQLDRLIQWVKAR